MANRKVAIGEDWFALPLQSELLSKLPLLRAAAVIQTAETMRLACQNCSRALTPKRRVGPTSTIVGAPKLVARPPVLPVA